MKMNIVKARNHPSHTPAGPQVMAALEPMDRLMPPCMTAVLECVTDVLREAFFLPSSKWALSLGQMAAILYQFARQEHGRHSTIYFIMFDRSLSTPAANAFCLLRFPSHKPYPHGTSASQVKAAK